MASLTQQYDWEELQWATHNTVENNFDGIRKVKKQAIERGLVKFEMSLSEKGKKLVPGLVIAYWRDLDKAFNSSYQDTMLKLVKRAMANRSMMSSRVQQMADTRSKYDDHWCYEWEDCHTRAFVLERENDVAKGLFRPLNQRRSVLSGKATSRRSGLMKKRVARKSSSKAATDDAPTVLTDDGIEVLDL